MHTKQLLLLAASMLLPLLSGVAIADDQGRVVRIAKLQIDPAQVDSYKAALKEEIEVSVRIEPGVLALYAVFEKDNATKITIFEIYADEKAYLAHVETPHFKKYKTNTLEMVKSLELIETVPIILGAKTK